MRVNADVEDEVKDSMAHDKHAAAIDDCKSSDDNKMLSGEAPSFNHDNAPGLVPTTAAMTPFKDGKGSPLNGLPVSLPLLSNNITNTAAVTRIHTSPPPLAPFPQGRFITAAAGPQYIMPQQPGMPIFIPPQYFRLPMVDGSTQTSSLLGNGSHFCTISQCAHEPKCRGILSLVHAGAISEYPYILTHPCLFSNPRNSTRC
jgi:hypothetical protein